MSMRQFNRGCFKTMLGAFAIVAQLKQIGVTDWILRGAVKRSHGPDLAPVYYLTTWTLKGKNSTQHTAWDLVSGE